MTAGGLCETIDLTEPEPRSFADFLGREERIKRSRQHRRRHSSAGIADCDHYVGAGCDFGVAGGKLSVDGHVLGFDDDPSAACHGVPRIDDEVKDCRLEFSWIDLRRGQEWTKRHDHFDLLADSSTHQVFDISDQLVGIDSLGADDLPSSVSQELPDEAFSSLRPFYRSLRQTFDFFCITASTLYQLNIADNDGQEVVEIVRDAPG